MARKKVAGECRKPAGPLERNLLVNTFERKATHISLSLCDGNARMLRPGFQPIEPRFPKLRTARRQVGNQPRPARKHIGGGGPRPELSCLERSHTQRETTARHTYSQSEAMYGRRRLAHDTGWLINSSRRLNRVAF
jgi:hypothetical protein